MNACIKNKCHTPHDILPRFHIFIHQTNNKLISTFFHVSHFLIRQANNQSQHAFLGILASHISHRSLLICSYSSYHEVQAIFSQKILRDCKLFFFRTCPEKKVPISPPKHCMKTPSAPKCLPFSVMISKSSTVM